MTTYYVDSAAGSNTAPYDTWAKAATALATIAAIDGAGDTIYVASTHAETTAGAVSLNWAGTISSPTRIVCADKTSGAPPATAATGATVKTSGNNALTLNAGGYVHWYGIAFTAGSGANGPSLTLVSVGGVLATFVSCDFILGGNTGGFINLVSANCSVVMENCRVQFVPGGGGNAGSGLGLNNACYFRWTGGSIISGGTDINTLLPNMPGLSSIWLEDLDLSAGKSSLNILSDATNEDFVMVRNCKMPTSWSGSLNSSTPGRSSISDMQNVDSSGTDYRMFRKTNLGSVQSETTLVKTSGATDGTTALSWKMISNGNPSWPMESLVTPEMVIWNTATGSSKTLTVDIALDSAGTALKDNEIWLEVSYLSASGAPLGTLIKNDVAANNSGNVLATAANQATSTASWPAMTTPTKQKLSVTFTPQMVGYIHAVVRLAKVSTTVYVDPLLQIS